MTALVVVRNSGGYVVAFGPNDGKYQPAVAEGCTAGIEEDPVLNFEPPTKDERIALVLATMGKGKDRTLIQQVIACAELVAGPALATQYGVTLEFAIMGLYARNKTYRESKDTELACQAIEGEP